MCYKINCLFKMIKQIKGIGVKVYSKRKLYNLFNAPTCFGSKLQPSSGSYKYQSLLQLAVNVDQNK